MMLGRKAPGSGVLSAAAGMDRGRTGERLHAALAGLQELHLLRDKQSAMVHWALTQNREESDSSKHENVSTEELRLEATLTLLKQQLTRLRRQDVGLKTHLQQLDHQINELKLDVCKASTEHLESDSRPSSGFYELSDGGSGSLSNSCTSVYSESLSSSQTSLLPLLSNSYVPHGRNVSRQTGVSRRCSADESTGQSDAPRSGVKLGSSCIRTATARAARQRPVSTGDLDRMIARGFGSFKSNDVKSSKPCASLQNPSVDPKYQSNLVSSNGTEVYCYPSPLHAVALQSPIFSCTGEQGSALALDGMPEGTLEEETQNPIEGFTNSRSAGYINKILQRSSSKINLLNGTRRNDTISSTQEQRPRSQEMTYGLLNVPQLLGSLQHITMPLENAPETGKTSSALNSNQQQRNAPGLEPNFKAIVVQTSCHGTHSAPSTDLQNNYFPIRNATGKTGTESDNGHSEKGSGHFPKESSMVPKLVERRSSFTFRREDGRASFDDKGGTPPSEFVHAQFVPAGSQRVKVRQADKKTKSVKLRKKSSEKSSKKQQQKHLSREFCTKPRADLKQSSTCKGKGTNLEESQINCSDCNGHFNSHHTPNNPHHQQSQSSKSTKSRKAPEPVHLPLDQAKKKQSSRKWPSASEIPLPPTLHTQRSKEVLNSRKVSMVRSVSARPRSGHWGCPPRALPHSLSTSSYFSYLESRYPAAPISSRYPPRCESEFSEYSAECASLFHSTIAASSDGEMSNYTTNRFGDSESSQGSQTASDSDSSLSLDEEDLLEEEEEDEGGLVWAQAAMGTTAAGFSLEQQPRSEPAACRIKASRALKKKIRRFQPASLKVMTLV
ncbi:hypothetical protein R3I94_012446 [Phoxinus phoxinus]